MIYTDDFSCLLVTVMFVFERNVLTRTAILIEPGEVGRCSGWGMGWTIRVLGQPTFVPAEKP